jgi:hypothetical protein
MTAEEFDARIVAWARSQPDIVALVQIGSRAQLDATVDVWSDWDYHLIVRDSASYRDGKWLDAIAPCWSVHSDRTDRGVVKVSAVFAGGWEADFVPLSAWQMKLVYWAMARPSLMFLFPKPLRKGIANTRLVVAPGYRVILGGQKWEERLSALSVEWPTQGMTAENFADKVDGFWRHAVWVYKKIMRGEMRAALRWMHRELSERRWLLLEEEARIDGRAPRPEARKAELWLGKERLSQTAVSTGVDQQSLARALLAEMALFEEVSRRVAGARSFPLSNHSAVADWMRSDLNKLAGAS